MQDFLLQRSLNHRSRVGRKLCLQLGSPPCLHVWVSLMLGEILSLGLASAGGARSVPAGRADTSEVLMVSAGTVRFRLCLKGKRWQTEWGICSTNPACGENKTFTISTSLQDLILNYLLDKIHDFSWISSVLNEKTSILVSACIRWVWSTSC